MSISNMIIHNTWPQSLDRYNDLGIVLTTFGVSVEFNGITKNIYRANLSVMH